MSTDPSTWPSASFGLPAEPYARDPFGVFFVRFLALPGCPGYGLDTEGIVWGCLKPGNGAGTFYDHWRPVKPTPNGKGYLYVTVRLADGSKRRAYVHRLVLETFVGSCPAGMECRHRDGDRSNNRLSNLAWGTPEDNAADKARHGTSPEGERNAAAKLNAGVVREIRTLSSRGFSRRAVAERFGVSPMTVQLIVDGKTWRNVG